MQLNGKRIFTAVMLVGAAITVYQVMSKPQPVAPPSSPSAVKANAQAFDQKLEQLEAPRSQGSAPAEIHFTSDEVSAGSQDGYVTFDPTEFKVGDLSIPVSLVNSALQKKLAEQRDALKLPEGIGSLRVEKGELVITQK